MAALHTFKSDGLTLSYRAIGAGPPLVLIHGWSANGQEWDEVGWPGSLTGRTLVIPDLRGHGESAKPSDPAAYQMEALAGDVIALVDAIGAPTADVFGFSMGATIALWTAVLAPARVQSLVAGAVADATAGEASSLARALRGLDPPTGRSERYRAYIERVGNNDMDALLACLDAGLLAPQCQELAIFGGEALLACGDLDRRREATERLAGCMPGGRFLLLEGDDHMGGFESSRFRAAVVEFLDEVSPR
jgi:pimeloyl-ACP methyl ester carboxylesterase